MGTANLGKKAIGKGSPPQTPLITPYASAALSKPDSVPIKRASPRTRVRICQGKKPSTLSTANSVLRSRTEMLIAFEITKAKTAIQAGASNQRTPQMMSRYASRNEEIPVDEVSHLTAGFENEGAVKICSVILLNEIRSGTRNQTRLRVLSAKGWGLLL